MKIIFVRSYDFPLGGAPQNRALGICRGLIEQGHKVEVHIFAPGRLNFPINHKKEQIYKAVPIFNHSWRWAPAKTKSKQVLGIIDGLVKTVIALIKSHRQEPFDYLFLNNNKNIYALPFSIIAKVFGARLGRELNEYPPFVLYPKRYGSIGNFIRKKTNYRWFDDFLIMTRTLIEFYRPLAKKGARFMHLPMTVDLGRFPGPVHDLSHAHDITYCGDLSQDKDGVLTLIEAYAQIKDEFPSSRLKLLGHNKNEAYMNKLMSLVNELHLDQKVILAGLVHPEEIPDHLYHSRLLVLSRPNSVQACGGFPTKLGEYLATGVPVAVTAIGEIPDYLTDEVNAFIAEPGCADGFANAMRRALSDDAHALEVGHAGRNVAIAHFAHSTQGKLIANFLRERSLKRDN